jgi:hypothetical protein
VPPSNIVMIERALRRWRGRERKEDGENDEETDEDGCRRDWEGRE